jgi:hypothetical protein
LPFHAVNVPGAPGYAPHLQRHHILPRQAAAAGAFADMFARFGCERLGFNDFRRNGLLLPATEAAAMRIGLPLHRGPHRRYNELVIERVGQIEASWQRTRGRDGDCATRAALMRIDLLLRALRRRLLDHRRWPGRPLNRQDPALDFSHLDRMADHLWGATALAQETGTGG